MIDQPAASCLSNITSNITTTLKSTLKPQMNIVLLPSRHTAQRPSSFCFYFYFDGTIHPNCSSPNACFKAVFRSCSRSRCV